MSLDVRGRAAAVAVFRLVVIASVLSCPSVGRSLVCAGDCDGDRAVTVDEIVNGVGIAVGGGPLSGCPSLDQDASGTVEVDELVAAVGNALGGCAVHTDAVVVTTDFFAGSFGVIGLDEPRAVTPSRPNRRVHRDAVVRSYGGLVYVVNRLFADNIQVLDPGRGFATRLQCSTGNGSNPHDIAFADPTKAYVSRFEERSLLIVNPAARTDCRDFVRGSIDLSGLADRDGTPDMDQMAVVGDRLYVALQRLDVNTVLRLPARNGALAVIDTTTDTLLGGIELTGSNPFAATKGLVVHNGNLYVAQAGEFGVLDGGIEIVDVRTGTAGGFFITEADLGGDVTDFVIVSERRAYAIVSRPGFSTALVAFDPVARVILDTLVEANGYTLFDIEMNDRGELFLADRARYTPGIRIFRAADGAPLVTRPIDLVLPPFEIVFLP